MIFTIETLGCKVNQYESAAIASLLAERGHRAAESGGTAECVILNTCAVTGEAARKSRQAARRLLRENPGAALAVCGCASGLEPEWAESLGAVLVGGAASRREFAERLSAHFEANAERCAPVTRLPPPGEPGEFETLPAVAGAKRTRAFLKIEDGCDNFCAYCVIPYARGRVRSMPAAEVEAAARGLGERGFREIVVTGIEISSYGKDLGGATLADAVEAAAVAAPDARIRLSSLEPSAVTPELIARLRGLPNLCPHFHLSLQSGCDATLRAMRRRYDAAGFFGSVALLRGAFPDCGVTADLIVGFPGETDGDFAETLAFVKRCAFSAVHVFPYSKRRGTLAAAMPGQLPNAVKSERARLARAAAEETRAAFLASQTGKTLDVLFETERDGVWRGYSGSYLEVEARADGSLRGKTLPVRITGARDGILTGDC
ncbi:MAG: tRNA (N(6)-L-threonylcarbamoyladenosine(37)-C(2))-methylthiotransferase MtaB [Oscillospiraceae bacterium]|jgi:threonylcarbamoyladenosine tRNA methylthiotransferase MtaB|nr:tRNA (N(6)-L-threonylcarbamoyladenosine(37)-C(2))-methylthiotransferase MtaB [Oscillospiraceae bacterium]